jgi:DNA-binding response OmpR family regulator
MASNEQLTLAARPDSAASARAFLRERTKLDSMRHAEADLLVTELIGNVIQHSPRASHLFIEVDEDRARIVCRGHVLDLSRTEYLMLKAMAARPEKVFSRAELMDAAGLAEASLERAVDTHIKALRAKLAALGADPIRTHRGLGYSLERHDHTL